jgi:hypothetical protein
MRFNGNGHLCDDNTKHVSLLKRSNVAETRYDQYKQNINFEKHNHGPILKSATRFVASYIMQQTAVLFLGTRITETNCTI